VEIMGRPVFIWGLIALMNVSISAVLSFLADAILQQMLPTLPWQLKVTLRDEIFKDQETGYLFDC
jgi:hypothetical protein